MPSLASWLKFIHIIVAFGFVTGLVGRNIVIRRATRSSDISVVTELLGVAGVFDKVLVIPGSFLVLAFGLFTMWAQHLPFFEHGFYWLVVSLIAYVSTIVLVPTVFIPRGKLFEKALTEAQQRGTVTPELTTAFNDRAVAAARAAEGLVVAFVISMMVLKPF
jgi:hypothetical protein